MKIENKSPEQYYYVGNCCDSFDDRGKCITGIFLNVSEFAELDENAMEISKQDFEALVDIPEELMQSTLNYQKKYYLYDNGFLVLYVEPVWYNSATNDIDPNSDMHYFFST